MELPKIEGFILNCTIPPLWPTYIGERRTPFSNAYKSEEVWKKCWGKYWEPIGNLKGT
jgi:hypothetical protein